MPSRWTRVRELPSDRLYNLVLIRDEHSTRIKATLTEKAVGLGVMFDTKRKDDEFNLSSFLGNDRGKFCSGTNFDKSAKNIKLEKDGNTGKRYLIADLEDAHGTHKQAVKYDLDTAIGLVDYVHLERMEPFYRLGPKPKAIPKRTLVLCFDGTSNHFSTTNTNVVKLVELLQKDNPERQLVYYQTGVGTYTSQAWSTSIAQAVAKTADLGIAWYLYQHIIDGYKYLMETYQDGDHIYIFGFSRGAFTARALAGMLHCVGLLPRHNIEHVPFAYKVYKAQTGKERSPHNPTGAERNEEPDDLDEDVDEDVLEKDCRILDDDPREDPLSPETPYVRKPPPKKEIQKPTQWGALGSDGSSRAKSVDPKAYKQTFCIPVVIDFVGVWDTVASVGSIIPQTLPYIDHNPSIKIFRQALALDERRANFVPSLWDHSRTIPGQNVREVWFRGEHADIGGGTPPPKRQSDDPQFTALSNIALRWMVHQCLENKTAIVFDSDAMSRYRECRVLEYRPVNEELVILKQNIRQAPRGEEKKKAKRHAEAAVNAHRRSLYQRSSVLDEIDIKHDLFESMGKFSAWRLLELWPSNRPIQTPKGPDTTRVPNFFKTRMIYRRTPKDQIFIHSSVVNFLEDPVGKNYVARAIWHGYVEDELPAIDSYEGEEPAMEWPDREAARLALNLTWEEGPGWTEKVKGGARSAKRAVGSLVKRR